MNKPTKIAIFSVLLAIGWLVIIGELFFIQIENETLEFVLFLAGILSIIESNIVLYKSSTRFKSIITVILDSLFWFA